jgi:hypothetical protein
MLEHTTPSAPQPPLPWPWAKIAGWMIVLALVVAFVVIPSFRNNVLHAWYVSRAFFAKLFGLR